MRRRLLGVGLLALAGCTAESVDPRVGGLVAPTELVVWEKDSIRLDAQVVDEQGAPLPGVPIVWASEDTLVADVAHDFLRFRHPGYTSVAALGGGFSQGVPVTSALQYRAFSSGTTFRQFYRWCGITERDGLWCYPSGALVAPVEDSLIRVPVPPGNPMREVVLGYQYLCGLTTGDEAYCWGSNQYGQLGADSGTGGYAIIEIPLPVKGGHRFISVSVATHQSCGITAAGDAWCWGTGYLGDGVRYLQPQATPVQVMAGQVLRAIALGEDHACALTDAGSVFCWGSNNSGQLGAGLTNPAASLTPVPVSSALQFTTLSAGADHTCGLAQDGTAHCWGSSMFGLLGVTDTVPCPIGYGGCALDPAPVVGSGQYRSLSVSGDGVCAIAMTGTSYCWGVNNSGQNGDGTFASKATPTAIAGTPAFVSLARGRNLACGMDAQGIVFCWGSYFGETPQRLPYQP